MSSLNPANIINNIDDLLFPGSRTNEFVVYTNDVLGIDSELSIPQQDTAFRLTTFTEFGYKNSVKIPWELVEQGSFNSDSVQDNPYNLDITGICAPTVSEFNGVNTASTTQLNNLYNNLNLYMKNNVLLTILQVKPLFALYKDLKILSFNFKQVSQRPNIFYGNITFQEIRLAVLTSPGNLSLSQVSDPDNSSAVNNGLAAGKSATSSQTGGIANNLRAGASIF